MGKINGKNKGSSYERKVAKIFRDIGFEKCTTSRFSSKEMDDKKVDLCGLPFYIQCKAVEQKLDNHGVIESMPQDGTMNFLFHKRNGRGTIVSMHEKDFFQMLEQLIKHGVIKVA